MTSENYTRLGTPDQLAAERLALRLIDHPKVRAAADATLRQMMSNPGSIGCGRSDKPETSDGHMDALPCPA